MLVINQLIPGTFEVVTDRGVSESVDFGGLIKRLEIEFNVNFHFETDVEDKLDLLAHFRESVIALLGDDIKKLVNEKN
jgi:hypothetical protein